MKIGVFKSELVVCLRRWVAVHGGMRALVLVRVGGDKSRKRVSVWEHV